MAPSARLLQAYKSAVHKLNATHSGDKAYVNLRAQQLRETCGIETQDVNSKGILKTRVTSAKRARTKPNACAGRFLNKRVRVWWSSPHDDFFTGEALAFNGKEYTVLYNRGTQREEIAFEDLDAMPPQFCKLDDEVKPPYVYETPPRTPVAMTPYLSTPMQ